MSKHRGRAVKSSKLKAKRDKKFKQETQSGNNAKEVV